MSDRNAKRLLVLSWLWLAIVAAYSIWSLINDAGLFRLVAELQIERFGGYSEKWTAILPGMLLAAPALWFIRRSSALAKETRSPDPRLRRCGCAAPGGSSASSAASRR